MNGLNHNALMCSAVPIPPSERSLQTVEVQPYFSVSEASLVLEGAVFDRHNNLLFVDSDAGFLANDLVFDNQGGFYFTDSRGIRPIHRVGGLR